ncbi:unnamed protein product [Leptidea sinapis]|uniref:Uncharacterized protein n=1 Tax=Leptidea sinapis TaxID=189913 RepID=A0A5E4R6I2_9NEOP|nr:unnamed protein product [Leptidea sinapis]
MRLLIARTAYLSLSDVSAIITPTSVTTPVSTSAKVTQVASKTTVSPESDVAFPAVLKGSQKQRVPPPVPPRGSPNPKRGGHLQTSEMKGEYSNVYISNNDIPFTSSDKDFGIYGHEYKSKERIACRVSSFSDDSSNFKLDAPLQHKYIEEDGQTNRSMTGAKGLFAQSNMMANFDIHEVMAQHLESGDYDGDSFTDSSSDDIIVEEMKDNIHFDEVEDKPATTIKTGRSPYQFLKNVGSKAVNRFSKKSNVQSVEVEMHEELEHNVSKMKKSPRIEKDLNEASTEKEKSTKQSIISSFSKFAFSIKDKQKSKPKIEIKTYDEEHGGNKNFNDRAVCRVNAKRKIDLYQKKIRKSYSDSESSSLSSVPEREKTVESQENVREKKKVFETTKKPANVKRQAPRPPTQVPTKAVVGNVSDKIRKFSVTVVPETKLPTMSFNEAKRNSFRRLSDKKIFRMKKDIEIVL